MNTTVPVTQETFAQAGKVLAVHLSYSSRAKTAWPYPKIPQLLHESLQLTGRHQRHR